MDRPLIFAHRGASDDAPENTLAAFRLAWRQGVDGIEGDFRLSAEGQVVCIHDPTTERTAGDALEVAAATLAELQSLDAGGWKGPQFAGERIPTLAEVLATVPAAGQFFIEVKCGPEIAAPLCAQLNESPVAVDQLAVISYHEEVLTAVQALLPGLRTFLLFRYALQPPGGDWSPTRDEVLAGLQRTRATGLGTQANQSVLTAEFLKPIRAAGYQLNAWTVDDVESARKLTALGFDSLTSNRPAALLGKL
jgi:glycerophosphoryl diester phosphodiesterase